MLLYLCFFILFLCFVWEKRDCLKGVCSQKSLLYVYTGYLFVFCVAISLDLFYSSDASAFYKFYLGICILFVHISFFIFIDYFKFFSIN